MAERIDLINAAFWGSDPQEELQWLREHAPIWRDDRNGVWAVATYDLVKHVSTHPEVFSNAGGIRPEFGPAPMMLDMDDPDHWQRRKLVNRGFTPARVRRSEDSIRRTVDILIDEICERGECDLVWDLASHLPIIVIADALGADPADRSKLLHWSEDILGTLGQDDDEARQRGADAGAAFQAWAVDSIAARRSQPSDDLMSVLVHGEVDGDRLDEAAIITETLLLLNGGDETTRHVISGGVFQLLTDRSRWEDVRWDRSLLPSAVEEMLRWVSPIRNMARTATQDVELGGRTITAGEKLLLLYPSANRDPSAFEDPYRFDIRRSPNDHVAFGFGPHFCLGASLARLEIRVMLDRLLDRLPDLELVEAAEPAHRKSNFVSGYEHLPVRFASTGRSGLKIGR
ncbi:MAG: cytochrome P450 [Acidimicrobiales bacterium]